jgi:hypothetical protein
MHLDEGALAAVGEGMDGVGHQLLAGTALARDQDIALGRATVLTMSKTFSISGEWLMMLLIP